MGLLTKRIAAQQQHGGPSCGPEIAGGQPLLRNRRERVLVPIRQALSLDGEALVSEPLGEIAAIDGQSRPGRLRSIVEERLEAPHVELDPRRPVNPKGVLLHGKDCLWVDAGIGQARSDEPQCLAK